MNDTVRKEIENIIIERQNVLNRVIEIERERSLQAKFTAKQVREMEDIVDKYCPACTPYPRSLKIVLNAHIEALKQHLESYLHEEVVIY